MKKKRRKLRRKRARERKARRDAKRNRSLLTEAQYEKAVRIAKLVHKDVYANGGSVANNGSSDDATSNRDSESDDYSDEYETSDEKDTTKSASTSLSTRREFNEEEASLLRKTALPSWQSIRKDTDYVGQAAWRQGPSDFSTENPQTEMEEHAPPSFTRNRLSAALQAAAEQGRKRWLRRRTAAQLRSRGS